MHILTFYTWIWFCSLSPFLGFRVNVFCVVAVLKQKISNIFNRFCCSRGNYMFQKGISKPGNLAQGCLLQSAKSFPPGCWNLSPPYTQASHEVQSQMTGWCWCSSSLGPWSGQALQSPSLACPPIPRVERIWDQPGLKNQVPAHLGNTFAPGGIWQIRENLGN